MSTRFHRVLRFVSVFAFLVMLIAGLAPVVAQDGPTSDPNDPLIAYMLGWYDTVLAPTDQVSQEDAEAYRSTSFIWHDGSVPQVTITRSEYVGLNFQNTLQLVAPDHQSSFERIVRFGDLVWVHYSDEMTLQAVPPFNWATDPWSHVQLPVALRGDGVLIARIEGGEFVEWWEYADYPLLTYPLKYYVCRGWVPPLAASDTGQTGVDSVPDHTLLMEGGKIALIQQLFDQTINRFERDYVTLMNASIIVHDPLSPDVWTLQPPSIRQWFVAMHGMMPDYHMEIQHIVEHEDMVWVHWRSTGTLTRPTTHPGLLAINSLTMPRAVEAEGVFLFRFEADKIAEWWWYEDNGLLTVANGGLCIIKPS